MAGRKKLPDIMDDVLSNEPQPNQQVDKSTNRLINLSTVEQNSDNTVKITFYIPEKTVTDIEDLWHTVRKSVKAEDKTKVNRSVIAQELISLALKSIKGENEQKAFVETLVRNLKTSQ